MDWRRVEVGVIGERKEMTTSRGCGFFLEGGPGIRYVRLVVEASYLAPTKVGNDTL